MLVHPVYDAYFAPLKHKHQYWFGVLLLMKEILLVTFAIPQSINLLLLFVFTVSLLYYMCLVHPYKSSGILGSFILNILLLSGFYFFTYTQHNVQSTQQAIAIGLSTGAAFLRFSGIVLMPIIMVIYIKCKQAGYHNFNDSEEQPM